MTVHENHILIDPLYEPLDMSTQDKTLYKKIEGLYAELLASFELRKAAWQLQSGLLFEAFPGCTHTRRAHAIGCWLVGWHSLRDVTVEMRGRTPSLGNWLKAKGSPDYRREFLLALLLHDIGHPPFSHSLEAAVFGGISHEDIGRSLIENSPVKKANYHLILRELLTRGRMQALPRTASLYKKQYAKAKGEVTTVHDILTTYHVDIPSLISILNQQDDEQDPKLWALSRLVDSEVDIDRIDHFLRDSYYSGIRFADYRIKSLLQNLVVCVEGSKLYKEIHEERHKEDPSSGSPPCFVVVRENGIEHVEYLLAVRQFIYDRVLSNPKNMKLTAALCMAVKQALTYDASLRSRLPFMTDPILLQVFREDRFRKRTIAGYSALLQGEHRTEKYAACQHYHLKVNGKTCPSDKAERIRDFYLLDENREGIRNVLRAVYQQAERLNREEHLHPRVLVHQCRLPGASVWWNGIISGRSRVPLGNCKGEQTFFDWLRKKELARTGKIVVWCRKPADLSEFSNNLSDILDPIS